MSKIFFVRHGQASFGNDNYDKLSDKGRLQSRILGNYLIKLGLSFDAVYSGKMERHKETADEVISVFSNKGLDIPKPQLISHLNEYNFNEIMESQISHLLKDDPSIKTDISNMLSDKKAFQKIFEKSMFGWISGKYDKPGTLKWEVYKDRVIKCIRRIMDENGRKKKIIIFSSGGTLSAVIQMALGISNEETTRICWQICNASLTQFMYNSERITLSSFNNTSYLELEGTQDIITYR